MRKLNLIMAKTPLTAQANRVSVAAVMREFQEVMVVKQEEDFGAAYK